MGKGREASVKGKRGTSVKGKRGKSFKMAALVAEGLDYRTGSKPYLKSMYCVISSFPRILKLES